MAVETLYASSLAAGTVAGSANALGAPDGTYTTDTGQVSWTARFAMGDPAGNTANGTHTVTVRVRKITGQTGTPTLNSIALYQAGALLATDTKTLGITSGTGVDVASTFAGSLITDPSQVEVEIVTTAAGGAGAARTPVQLDAITWSGDFTTVATNHTRTPTDAAGLSDAAVTDHQQGGNGGGEHTNRWKKHVDLRIG